jgi:hypothetical protein
MAFSSGRKDLLAFSRLMSEVPLLEWRRDRNARQATGSFVKGKWADYNSSFSIDECAWSLGGD